MSTSAFASAPGAFLVTGGSSGLGAAAAARLLKDGHSVVLLDLQEPQEALHANARFVKADVTQEDQVAQAVKVAREELGGVKGAVNAAGIAIAAKVLGRKGVHSLEDFNRVLSVNVGGTFNVVRLVSEAMALQQPHNADGERGVIINTASVAAFDGQIGQAAYSASKGAIVAMTLPLAREFSSSGIRVATIAPGIFKTPMMAGLPQKAQDSLAAAVPFPKRLGDPAEYGDLVSFIVHNSMLNGEVIRLDGSIRMQ